MMPILCVGRDQDFLRSEIQISSYNTRYRTSLNDIWACIPQL